ncbi:hypothetical protein ACHAW6_002608 [Cyclotella cf. meneghiniana]
MVPLKWPEFDEIRLSDIQEEIIQEYNLQDKATPNGGYTSIANKTSMASHKAAALCIVYWKSISMQQGIDKKNWFLDCGNMIQI